MTNKAEITRKRILDAALELFRTEGFEAATMRTIAQRAHVATGAAYYYYPSKEMIVLDFYERASLELEPLLEQSIPRQDGFEAKLRALLETKLFYFAPNRSVLRALLRKGADPAEPVSPFSEATRTIRARDIAWFQRVIDDSGTRVSRDLAPHLAGLLWFFQMGLVFFWVLDDSEGQARTGRLIALSVPLVAGLIRLAALPLMRPLRRTAIELIETVKGVAV